LKFLLEIKIIFGRIYCKPLCQRDIRDSTVFLWYGICLVLKRPVGGLQPEDSCLY
jgi:hypothetical protein